MKNSMKKIVVLLLALCLVLSACGKKAEVDNTQGSSDQSNTVTDNKTDDSANSEETGKYTPGTYEGEGQGFGGTVTVKVTVDANAITAVEITAADETPAVGGAAVEELTEQVMNAQSAEIDGVSGATLTSNAVKAAVTDALNKAQGIEVASADKAVVADGTYNAKTPGFGPSPLTARA